VFERYADALAGVEDVLRLTVVYWAHEADREGWDDDTGAFARRGPTRPNPLNICTGTVLGVDGREVRLRGLDAVDGSPLVDLKPALQAER
jgi:tRNA (Thr-GGU) A37 N-methylase